MAQSVVPTIREALLAEIDARTRKTQIDATLQQRSVLDGTAAKLGVRQNPEREEAILTEWGELFRTGLLAWGLNLANPGPPHFHMTERGRQALANWTRDPSNPTGYLRHLDSVAKLDLVSLSYLREGLDCYSAGFIKAAAVMVGGAAERIILDLRDNCSSRLSLLGRLPIPAGLEPTEWRVKTITDALRKFFDCHKGKQPSQLGQELTDAFEGYWAAFAVQIRAARNDAGHPTSVEPLTPDTVHASLLIFPELAKLANKLTHWVMNEFK